MANATWGDVERLVEGRIREQIDRHMSVNPNTDPKKVVELQIRLEKEKLEQRLKKLEESEDFDETREIALRFLINDFLPKLERKLTRR